ncbi:MAG: hypothetical protein RLZZ587_1 [Actinomycetota bacterium]|jgi:hypothetical protein
MTEQQKYDVIGRIGSVELRRYHPVVMADVVVDADYGTAGSMGFRPLVGYISRNNIAMTAPVVQEPTAQGSWIVSFVMPDGMSIDSMPRPAGSSVTLRDSPEHVAAALRFSGTTSTDRVTDKERELRQILAENNIIVNGQVRIARFDPPWKPGFLRHNEVVLPIAR